MKPRKHNIVLQVPESIMVSTVGETTGRPERPREEGVIAVPVGVPVILPVAVWSEISYHRPQHPEGQKAWKVLNSIPVASPATPADLNDLLRSYKRLYALATRLCLQSLEHS